MQKNEYIQPLIIATLSGLAAGGYNFYRSADPARALTVCAVAFLVLFWGVLRGNKLQAKKQQDAKKHSAPESNKAP